MDGLHLDRGASCLDVSKSSSRVKGVQDTLYKSIQELVDRERETNKDK